MNGGCQQGLTPIWPAASASASRASTFCSMRANADRDELDEDRRPPHQA